MRRVAVTGIGVVSALGFGIEAFWNELLNARSGVREIRNFDTSILSVRIAAQVPDYDPAVFIHGISLELLDRFSELALIAAKEAVEDSGITSQPFDSSRAGVAIGSGAGGITTQAHNYQRLYTGNSRVHPFTIPRVMNSAGCAHLSMTFGCHGPTLSTASACAAAGHAIGEAGEMIRAGRADIMLAGGSDATVGLGAMRAWEALRVLAPANGDPARACRPFSRDRQGLVLGEGAAVAVLEDWDHATRRGARIRGELAGYGSTADGGHITQPGVDAPVKAIQQAIKQAGLNPSDVDYVSAHGTGTRLNDSTETEILKRAFGEHASRLAISSTKSMHAHALGASPALEFVATVLALERGIIPPTANYTEPDPECDLDYVPNVARERPIHAAISNSFAFGGLNAVLALKKV